QDADGDPVLTVRDEPGGRLGSPVPVPTPGAVAGHEHGGGDRSHDVGRASPPGAARGRDLARESDDPPRVLVGMAALARVGHAAGQGNPDDERGAPAPASPPSARSVRPTGFRVARRTTARPRPRAARIHGERRRAPSAVGRTPGAPTSPTPP